MQTYTRPELLAEGMTPHEITKALQQKHLTRLGVGVYVKGCLPDPRSLHLARMATCPTDVMGLESAAIAHGLPVAQVPDRVQFAVKDPEGGKRPVTHQNLGLVLPAHHVTEVDGHRVTTVARTLADLARARPNLAALVTWEAAMWRAREADELEHLGEYIGRAVLDAPVPDRDRVHAVWSFASTWSARPLETLSRKAMLDLGLPQPEQQFSITDAHGDVLAVTNFGWPAHRVAGECIDGPPNRPGRGPYCSTTLQDDYLQALLGIGNDLRQPPRLDEFGDFSRYEDDFPVPHRTTRRQVPPAESDPAEQALLEQQQFLDRRLEEEGWVMVRWTRQDLAWPELFQFRILSAFRRAEWSKRSSWW